MPSKPERYSLRGAEVQPKGGTPFRVWAPRVATVDGVLDSGPGAPATVPLKPEPNGYHAGFVSQAAAGSRYRFRRNGQGQYSGPASRCHPDGPHGSSQIVDPAAFAWRDAGWPGVGIEGQVIYEMHIGTFSREGPWAAAQRELPELAACGPNQILAVSLDHPVLDQTRWHSVMEVATKRLLAPAGLRSLTPGHPDYKARYDGDLRSRDAAYHQGTVWAWLIDPSVAAWFKLHPDRPAEARQFLAGLAAHFEEACSGSISEVFDAGPPYCRAAALSRPGAWPRCCAVGSRRRARETTRSIEQAWPLMAIQRSNKIKLGSMHHSTASHSQHNRRSLSALLFRGIATVLLLLGTAYPAFSAKAVKNQFSFENVEQAAKTLAAVPYQPPPPIPEALKKLDYDTWRKIRFKPDSALWGKTKSPFTLQFFHPGFLYDRTVKLNSIDAGKVAPVVVTKEMFDYSQVQELKAQLPTEIGAAGFRVHATINTAAYQDEFTVFLGASYFRAVAKGQTYGLSARGVAVNTAEQEGEEFPWFREFWIEKPAKGQKKLTVYALLDSESLAGAYAFTIIPGRATVMDVTSRLYLRTPIKTLGIAPLTSMFLYGENSPPSGRMDWRPEVHDSDGLLVHFQSGEWLWRPARNPLTLLTSSFEADNVKGFGLFNRDTDFNDYQDIEARYEKRPSLWIEPRGDWGPGKVEMVLIPSDQEIHDNVVAFFSPREQAAPGKPMRFDYRMRWLTAPGGLPPGVMTIATRTSQPDKNSRFFVVDFLGDKGKPFKKDAKAEAVVSVGPGGKLLEQQCFRNPATGGFRLTFKIGLDGGTALQNMLPEKRGPIELRAFLKFDDKSVSETWSYAVTPGNS